MIPEQLKKMFGLKDEKDMSMANNIWKMLDDMSQSDPEQYKNFVQKNVKEGMTDARAKTEQKEKPYRVKPKAGICLTMKANLNERPLQNEKDEKLLITKTPWNSVRSKFADKIKITLNITYSERIRDLTSRKSKKPINTFLFHEMPDIQCFYYSFQGPQATENPAEYDVCMILNSQFFGDLMNQPQGKRTIMGLCISYLQDRIGADKNPLLKQYNPDEYKRLVFYNIDKHSFEVLEKRFQYGENVDPIEFLLEKEVDRKRVAEEKEETKKKETEIKPKRPEIIFKQAQKEEASIPEIVPHQQPLPTKNKKVLIEVLKEEETEEPNEIAYNQKQSSVGYSFQFLLPGISSIKEVDLEMKSDCILLKTEGKNNLKLVLKKPIDQATIKARFKKAEKMLKVDVKYL